MLLEFLVLVLVLMLEGQSLQQVVDLSEIDEHYASEDQVEKGKLENEETYVSIAQQD